jgi:acyl-CoA reductase-like NAD-dependent aldehyde dehydrogenase
MTSVIDPKSETVETKQMSLLEQLHPDLKDATVDEVNKAVATSRECFSKWSKLTIRERVLYLRKVRKEIANSIDEIVDVIVADTGKIPVEALVNEILVTLELIKWYENNVDRILGNQRVSTGLLMAHKRGEIRYQPLGVVGIISPWNYPLTLSMGPIMAALFAGNTVVVKPSEVTPHVGIKVGEIFKRVGQKYGEFENLVQVVVGSGFVGEYLVRSGVDKVAFTGSVKTGKHVMAVASETLTPVVLELGGKDPMVVLEDANIDRAARGAVWGAFTNSGQTCMAVERVYVHEKIFDKFVEKVVDLTSKLRQGEGSGMDLGAMTWQRQTDIVKRHLKDAVDRGAKVLVGGEDVIVNSRASISPAVLVDVDHTMDIMTQETFGPVLPIMKFKDDEEGLKLANDSVYGLNSSVWSKNSTRIEYFVRNMQAGNVCVNDTMVSYAISALPFGGVRESGIGRTHGEEGLREMSQIKSVAYDRFNLKTEIQWMPIASWLEPMAKKLIKFRNR